MSYHDIKWSDWTRNLERMLRLKTFPVGLKLLDDAEELKASPWIRRPQEKLSLCQLITIVRTFDWTVGGTAADLVTPGCASVLGLAQLPEFVTDGSMRNTVWLEKKEDAALCESVIQRIPYGKFKAFMLAPTAYDPFVPDMVLIYIHGAARFNHERAMRGGLYCAWAELTGRIEHPRLLDNLEVAYEPRYGTLALERWREELKFGRVHPFGQIMAVQSQAEARRWDSLYLEWSASYPGTAAIWQSWRTRLAATRALLDEMAQAVSSVVTTDAPRADEPLPGPIDRQEEYAD